MNTMEKDVKCIEISPFFVLFFLDSNKGTNKRGRGICSRLGFSPRDEGNMEEEGEEAKMAAGRPVRVVECRRNFQRMRLIAS